VLCAIGSTLQGSLMYLMVCTRPDIAYAVSIVSKYLANPVIFKREARDVDATLQHVVALSTTEAEYMALTEAVKESIWLKGLLIELGVNLRYHFIKEIVESKEIEVAKIGMKDNAADVFTMVVLGPKF
ncbi:hypothetical protein Tco_1194868, partial [Tanacetum coccineum]